MNEKCSLSNLSRYLQVIGFLSLIIILIIVVYYYLQSNHSSILEKYESYNLRDCKVYFTEGETNIKNCDITQETSNYTGLCSYRFDGWSEFDTYTDKDGKIITYPKKVYTETQTNTKDFNNPMFTNNCFKPYTDETCLSTTSDENCIPPEFEYNANSVVKYDEQGTSGNTAVGTNIYGGLRYSSMQFLNTTDPRYNNTNLISSICDVAPTASLNSLNNKIFYMFEFNGTTNKLENIRSVSLDSNQTTFSPVLSDSVLTKLPPPITETSFGIQYDATNRNLPIKIFKKNNIPRNIAVFKFNYMSYICKNSQIKNYMIAKRIIIPEKFIKYGSSTTPNYSKNISISNDMSIYKGWNWSDYSSADFNVDYSDMLKTDLTTAISSRKRDIKLSYKEKEDIAEAEYDTAKEVFDAASQSRTDFAANNSTFSSLIGKRNATSTSSIFDYKKGYNISPINNLNFSIPQGATATKIGSDICITFPYTGNAYTFTTTETLVCDILVVGGGGAGGGNGGGGGGAGGYVYATNIALVNGATYNVSVGRGGIGTYNANTSGNNSSITGGITYIALGGGKGGGRDTGNRTSESGGSGGGGGGSSEAVASTGQASLQNSTYGYGLGFAGRIGFEAHVNSSGGGGGGAGGLGTTGTYQLGGNGGNGVSNSITGSEVIYCAGGGGGVTINGTAGANGSSGNGSFGSGSKGGNGGIGSPNGLNGIVIIRIKINNDNVISPFKTLDTNINQYYSNEPLTNPSKITIDASSIQSKVLTSFIFLQKGYYYFKADINGGGYHSSMMIYSDLLLFDEANKDVSKRPPTYNTRIVYKNNNNVLKVFNKRIYIPNSKFYKLAYSYTLCNTTTNKIDANIAIDCNYRTEVPALNPNEYVNLDSNINNAIGNYISIDNISFNLSLNEYLFCGVNLNADYNNANTNIMSRLANVKYTSNNQATNYASMIGYLDSINFFNIANLQKDMNAKKDYMDIILPAIIVAEYGTDENIKNINKFITIIDQLKSSRVNVNYSSQLPTTSPSIYNNITIDEIFGKNYERLITKDKVKDDKTLFNANLNIRAPLTKKIYVEAVA
jgi:hypothetical protein